MPVSGERATGARTKDSGSSTPRSRASRSRSLPPPPTDLTFDYAACRDELRGIDPGEVVLAIEATNAWQQVMVPILDAIEAHRRAPLEGERKRRGRPSQYTVYDFERLELLRRVKGFKSTQATRDWLTTDKARKTRQLFRLNWGRPHFGGKERKWMAGVPSDGLMSDYRIKWFPEAERADAYRALERWLVVEKLMASPWAQDELDVLFADGSKLETHYTPPHYDEDGNITNQFRTCRKTGALINNITAPDAGYLPNTGKNAHHSGTGWNIIFVSTTRGTVLTRRIVPLHASEKETLTAMVEELGEVLSQFEKRLRVLTTDGAFHCHPLRAKLHDIGVVENIHLSSHGKQASASASVKARDGKRYNIDGTDTWFADGHRALHCKCGKGKTVRRLNVGEDGKAKVASQGECDHGCGSIRIQAGLWRRTQLRANKKQTYVRIMPGEQDLADWAFGNPLTYHDPVAGAYGKPRFPGQEGAFGSQFTQRFELLKGKRWFRRQTQVELETSMVICITHALSLERYRRMAAGASPPLAQAA